MSRFGAPTHRIRALAARWGVTSIPTARWFYVLPAPGFSALLPVMAATQTIFGAPSLAAATGLWRTARLVSFRTRGPRFLATWPQSPVGRRRKCPIEVVGKSPKKVCPKLVGRHVLFEGTN